jgi:hypothetical protein
MKQISELSDKKLSRYIAAVPNDKGKHGEGIKRAVYKLTQGRPRPKKLKKEEVELDELAYSKSSVNKEIRKDSRIGRKEAKLIHRLLRGRTTDKKQDHSMASIIRKEETREKNNMPINELYKNKSTLIQKARAHRQDAWQQETLGDYHKPGTPERKKAAHKANRSLKASNIAAKMVGHKFGPDEEALHELTTKLLEVFKSKFTLRQKAQSHGQEASDYEEMGKLHSPSDSEKATWANKAKRHRKAAGMAANQLISKRKQ